MLIIFFLKQFFQHEYKNVYEEFHNLNQTQYAASEK